MSGASPSRQRIVIRLQNGQRNAYLGDCLVASIYDHRGRNRADRFSTVCDNWGVAWRTGRYDWHGTLAEARANVLKGPSAGVLPTREEPRHAT
jgi:hypothetical protein